jgi:hypothetical protein
VDGIADTALAVLRADADRCAGTVAVAVAMAQNRLATRRAARPTFR